LIPPFAKRNHNSGENHRQSAHENLELTKMTGETCRICNEALDHIFVDLGMSPIANDYVPVKNRNTMEPFYPLCVYVCQSCWLVQLPPAQSADNIFRDDYAYYSSVSKSWLQHARSYVEMMISRFGLDSQCSVVEVASNDGYLLQYFRNNGVPVMGIEPCKNVADAAREIGIPTMIEFFGSKLASRLVSEIKKPDLIVGNNVLAHVPDLMDFVAGLRILLADDGVITMEFPHLQKLIEFNQFDTIYHEHFSYFSFIAVTNVFQKNDLRIFDVEELPTHGGSLRIYACHEAVAGRRPSEAVRELLEREHGLGFDSMEIYKGFEKRVHRTKRELLKFLISANETGKQVVGYGAPAKGNTLLNYCGVGTDMLAYTVDLAPSKQGTLLPGTRIPVHNPEKIFETRPDYILILPWNIKDEIIRSIESARDWGGQFLVPIPEVRLLD
jgi:SAM-dependent methyltransferase